MVFLLFGGIVILISLTSANRLRSQGEGLQLAEQRIYFQEEISPDHLLYPLKMVVSVTQLPSWVQLRDNLALLIL